MTERTRSSVVGLVLLALLAAGVAVLLGPSQSNRAERGSVGANGIPRLDLRAEKYTLANGLEVILRQESRVPVVAVNLWYHVGPANEEPGRTGFAHLFEHMMFQGSAHVQEGEADRLLEAAGTSENASTSFDYTNYIVPDVPPNQLELALWLQSDRMGFLLDRLDQESLSNQQAVVRNERRERFDDAPYGLADEELYHRLFPKGHPYYASIIGSHADIQAARLDDVRAFFRQFYVPNNASLAIVGDIDVARTKELVEKYFGTIPRGPDVPRRSVPAPPLTSEQRVTLTDTVALPEVTMAWLTPPVVDPATDDAVVTSRLLDGTRASRLSRRLVHDLRIAQSVETDADPLANATVFSITASPKPGHTLAEIEAVIDEELRDLAQRGPTRAEVDAAKTALIAGTVRSLEDLGNFGGLADQLNYHNHYFGDPNRIEEDLRRTAAVTPARVQRFAARHLDPGRRVVVEVMPGPKMPVDDPPAPEDAEPEDAEPVDAEPEDAEPEDAEPEDAEPEDAEAADGNETREAAGPDEAEDGAAGEQRPSAEPWRNAVPQPGPPVATPVPPVQRFTLENGLAVWLLESRRLPLVSASLVSRAGSATDPPDRRGRMRLATAALDAGTTRRDALGLSQELESAGATLGDDTGKDGTWVTASSLSTRTGATLDILADVVRNPTFPDDEVERLRDTAIVDLRQDQDDADTIAGTVARQELYGPGHPYAHPSSGTEDGLRALTVADLRQAHALAFTPETSALLLSGDITAEQARTLATKAFGAWTDGPADGAAAGGVPRPPGGTPGRVLVVDKPGASQTALAFAAPGLARSDPGYEPLLLTNQIFGGSFASRLNTNLREERGYTYGAYSAVEPQRGTGLVTIKMAVQGATTAYAVRETRREAAALAATGPSAEELDRTKLYLAGSLRTLFDTNRSAVSTLRTLYLDDLPADYFETRPARLGRITIGDIAAMGRDRFAPNRFIVVAVGDRSTIEVPLRGLEIGPVTVREP